MRALVDPAAPEAERPLWLTTFADLVALLLTFMIMMFATQTLDHGKWQALIGGLAERLNPRPIVVEPTPTADRAAEPVERRPALDLAYLEALLRDKAARDPVLAGLVIHRLEDRIVVTVPADLLFAAGSAVVSNEARRVVQDLGGLFANLSNRVDVVGHTDPNPVRSGAYGSNWELSVARAMTVANALRRAGYTRPLTAFGFGDTRFEEVPADLPAERRRALARRVDIVIRARGKED